MRELRAGASREMGPVAARIHVEPERMQTSDVDVTGDPISAGSWAIYFARLGWVRFKAAFSLPIDVDKNFYAADAGWRLKRGVLPKGVKITVAGRSDGGGMQALSRISGLNFAATFGATYVHTPFLYVEHGDDGIVHGKVWETFLNLGEGELAIGEGDYEVVDYVDYYFGRAKLTDRTVLRFQQCYWPGKQAPATYYRILPRLREKLRFSPRPPDAGPLVVAVHVRRGDVAANRNNDQFTDNARIVAAVKQLIGALDRLGLPRRIVIHSQGDPAAFAEFRDMGCELSLDAEALWTLRQLMEADVLVMSKSSFSFISALANVGVKLYEPWLQNPLPDWIVRRSDGRFDERRVEARLAALFKGRDFGAARVRDAEPAREEEKRHALSEER